MGQQKAQLSPDASIARDLTSVSSAAHMEDLNVGKPCGELVCVRQGQKDQCVCLHVTLWLHIYACMMRSQISQREQDEWVCNSCVKAPAC